MTESAPEDGTGARPVPFIRRVRLKNYKSIASCDVRLGPLTILVGPNGSGKSNFLDALAFLSRAVATTPAEAVESRGGLGEILRRVPGQTGSFSIAIEATVSRAHQQFQAKYRFEIGWPVGRGFRAFEVAHEECVLERNGQVWRFHSRRGSTEIWSPDQRPVTVTFEPDRLYLLVASTQHPFASLFEALHRIPFFNFAPGIIRSPQQPAFLASLGLNGEHLGDVLAALVADGRGYKERIDAYLRSIVPGITSIEPYRVGNYMTMVLRANTGSDSEEVEFGPESMSEGTVRAAAVLAALFQPPVLDRRIRLIGIEEPELALHPASAGVLFDALAEATEHVQVIANSQSADLLDREDLDVSVIRPVTMRDGLTAIGEVDHASREIVQKKLYTLGELMRGNQLSPQQADPGSVAPEEA
jgi:predicted ATPase